jgi:hypothetical protein
MLECMRVVIHPIFLIWFSPTRVQHNSSSFAHFRMSHALHRKEENPLIISPGGGVIVFLLVCFLFIRNDVSKNIDYERERGILAFLQLSYS